MQRPWPALWALVIGFFMILVDTTIVSVAMPRIMEGLHTDINGAIWVTSAYLLAYAVPLLITGRLGDRVGPKTMYLIGLAIFTGSSLWCGLSDSIEMLIVARIVQGLGAAAMTPQTMTVITRLFPGEKRGPAMAVWGATAGVATLVGPLLGGVLTDLAGWEWIFFVNIPVGIIGVVLAIRNVPRFPIHSHSFDWIGVVISSVAMFLLVFGIQEGETYDWGRITDHLTVLGVQTPLPVSVPGLIITGTIALVAFVLWQARNRREPLVPLSLFSDRNFTVANIAIATMGFAVTGFGLPLTLYLQLARGYSPTQAALLFIPMALVSFVMARPVGRLVGRIDPRFMAMAGFAVSAVAMVVYALMLHADTPIGWLVLPSALIGFGNSLVWSPLSMSATYNLSSDRAGAGSGVYNTTRQIGSVLGSAAIAAVMAARITAHLGVSGDQAEQMQGGGQLPSAIAEPFSAAMGQSMLLPAVGLVLGFIATCFFAPIKRHR
ncbi:MAG TPA: DHA2 family efflux MFS transporter permease subunit [Candidatus Avipropionibacterium avicola]|uniref:DHA2 family efflux MFS transporter permease subunit n=1 Tax=Candidatus Avipropionibacterium avicola TaxID=2840701 RepID=A0A9D1GXJ1_9ACTN|nr:DHA2 family efflux MFS transporter permease subunit [Candidatus Avipropionibacterium avicola]